MLFEDMTKGGKALHSSSPSLEPARHHIRLHGIHVTPFTRFHREHVFLTWCVKGCAAHHTVGRYSRA